jgi:hypothetical protein
MPHLCLSVFISVPNPYGLSARTARPFRPATPARTAHSCPFVFIRVTIPFFNPAFLPGNPRYLARVRRPDGRSSSGNRRREESPGSTETRCRVTPGGGNPRESATENKPPARASAPAGKGETVRQERTAVPATGTARQAPPGARPNRDGTWQVFAPSSGSVARGVR